jgi:hypothetical protein
MRDCPAHFDQLGANTEPAGSQYSDTSDHEQGQGLAVYGDSAYGTAAARVVPTVPVGTTP